MCCAASMQSNRGAPQQLHQAPQNLAQEHHFDVSDAFAEAEAEAFVCLQHSKQMYIEQLNDLPAFTYVVANSSQHSDCHASDLVSAWPSLLLKHAAQISQSLIQACSIAVDAPSLQQYADDQEGL